jgi:hypothetical protein
MKIARQKVEIPPGFSIFLSIHATFSQTIASTSSMNSWYQVGGFALTGVQHSDGNHSLTDSMRKLNQ